MDQIKRDAIFTTTKKEKNIDGNTATYASTADGTIVFSNHNVNRNHKELSENYTTSINADNISPSGHADFNDTSIGYSINDRPTQNDTYFSTGHIDVNTSDAAINLTSSTKFIIRKGADIMESMPVIPVWAIRTNSTDAINFNSLTIEPTDFTENNPSKRFGIIQKICNDDGSSLVYLPDGDAIKATDNYSLYSIRCDGTDTVAGQYGLLIGHKNFLSEIATIEAIDTIAEEQAQVVTATNVMVASVKNNISYRMADVKGNSDDPFFQIFGAYDKKGTIDDVGYKSKIWGCIGGLDFIHDMKNSDQVRYGIVGSLVKSNIKFHGNDKQKSNHQRMLFGGAFIALEQFNSHNLKTNISGMVGFGSIKNKISRIASTDDYLHAKYNANDLYLNIEIIKNIKRWNAIQFGPWASVTYNHYRQKAYTEIGDDGLSFSKMHSDKIDTILGISAEKEIHYSNDSEKRLKLFGKIGWSCAIKNSQSSIDIMIGGVTLSPLPTKSPKHSVIAEIGFRNKINRHIEFSGTLLGEFNRKKQYYQVTIGAGYNF